jgi:hypothetical protein
MSVINHLPGRWDAYPCRDTIKPFTTDEDDLGAHFLIYTPEPGSYAGAAHVEVFGNVHQEWHGVTTLDTMELAEQVCDRLVKDRVTNISHPDFDKKLDAILAELDPDNFAESDKPEPELTEEQRLTICACNDPQFRQE